MKTYITLFAYLITATGLYAQQADTKHSSADSLMNAMNSVAKPEAVIATFKSTRLILSQTTETVKKNNLNFLVVHRFGDVGGVGGGSQTLWGFDNATDIYIGFEYGLTNNLNIDFGRSRDQQLLDLELKYALIHQTSDDRTPFALTVIGKGALNPSKDYSNLFNNYSNRLAYFAQAIFARKFSPNFSLQLSPSFIRTNLPNPYVAGNNEQQFFALGAAGRLKLTKRLGIVVDYTHPFSTFRQNSTDPLFYDPLAVGIEIETGGHVFTINFTNATSISEINYLTHTQSSWTKGQFRLGFTISRMFDLNPKRKKQQTS